MGEIKIAGLKPLKFVEHHIYTHVLTCRWIHRRAVSLPSATAGSDAQTVTAARTPAELDSTRTPQAPAREYIHTMPGTLTLFCINYEVIILFFYLRSKKSFILQNTASSECMSKTLDSASAHFAASAVVNTPNNENRPQIASVNGVLSNSGMCSSLGIEPRH